MNRFATAFGKALSKVPVKIKVSFCLLFYALVLAIVKGRTDGILCLIAMTFCFAGDVALNHRKNRNEQTSRDFKVGMAMFMVAHVFYAATYFARISNEYANVLEAGPNWLLFLVVDGLLFFVIAETLNERLDMEKYEMAVLVYTMLITTSFCMTFFYANLAKSISSLACVGGAALVASDLVIAFERFANYETNRTRVFVWVSYVAGQFLMITFA